MSLLRFFDIHRSLRRHRWRRLRRQRRWERLGAVDNHLIVNLLGDVGAGLDALPSVYAGRVDVNLVKADAAEVAAVARVAAKADAACVAHPHGRVVLLALGGEDAVVVAVVTKRRSGLAYFG